MKYTDIYQTLEDRQNYDDVEEHGPYFCCARDANGIPKNGVKEPWLGEGYYFWDTRIADARWWGDTIYCKKGKGYIICHTTYDQHSPLLYDLVGDVKLFDEFVECAELIKTRLNTDIVSFPVVLTYMKKLPKFDYKAIRVWPHPQTFEKTAVRFPGNKLILRKADKIQVCFFDKTLLNNPYKMVEKKSMLSTYPVERK